MTVTVRLITNIRYHRRERRLGDGNTMALKTRAVAALAVCAGLAGVPATVGGGSALAATPTPAVATRAVAAGVLGTGAATAAGSCWEIKKARPSAADGTYWLLTPAMSAPQQFYCDMTTSGGGWVLVGKGREGWTTNYLGQGAAASLLSDGPTGKLSTAYQLPSPTVEALLDGGRVDALDDGVRIKRATNKGGTAWQEVREAFSKKDRWSWTFGAENPLQSYSFDGVSSADGSISQNFGTDDAYRRVFSTSDSGHGYRFGFAYGSSVAGSPSATSYLWSTTEGGGAAHPYSEVYVRPRITSSDPGFTTIADGGTAAIAKTKTLLNNALVSPWGVATRPGTTAEEIDVEVQAFTQSGQNMYVGGNFKYVQKDAAGTAQVTQPYLAAFDINTGELVSGFKPVLNEQVRALTTLPDGTVVAGGDFSSANGQAATGVVALDPATGKTKSGWSVSIQNRITGGTVRVRSLEVDGGWVYIGGALTHVAGGSRPTTYSYMRQLGRVSVANGTPSTDWNPNLDGTVVKTDGSDDGNRMYAAGYFTHANNVAALKAAAILTAPGASLATPTWSPVWSASANYQQAIQEIGNRVWVGGSEHSLFSFSTSTFDRLSGNIAKPNGDTQAIASGNGLLFAGCHCDQYEYENAYTWSNLSAGWTRADALKWFGEWDPTTGARVPDFTPNFAMRNGQGIWAIKVDTLGNVWAGGAITTVGTASGQKFSGGFARFAMADSVTPPKPTSFRETSQDGTNVTLAWDTVSDAQSGGVRYQVLRDDRPIAVTTKNTGTITVPTGGSNRFFVRAVDGSGNVSASTSVVTVANTAPHAAFTSTTNRLVGTFDASGSSDAEGPIADYAWDFGDGSKGTGKTPSHTYAAAGSYSAVLTVTDAGGTTATATHTVSVDPAHGSDVVIGNGASWRWRYDTAAPPADWNSRTFDASAWKTGRAVLGFNNPSVDTDIDTFSSPSSRPVTAYFTKQFPVGDASAVTKLQISAIADDGAVVYVNGQEVGRQNMPAGKVTPSTFASTAVNTSTAVTSPLSVDVPASVLVDGTNVVSVETHLNYKTTKNVTFDLKATLVS